jgi:hypothetical protein
VCKVARGGTHPLMRRGVRDRPRQHHWVHTLVSAWRCLFRCAGLYVAVVCAPPPGQIRVYEVGTGRHTPAYNIAMQRAAWPMQPSPYNIRLHNPQPSASSIPCTVHQSHSINQPRLSRLWVCTLPCLDCLSELQGRGCGRVARPNHHEHDIHERHVPDKAFSRVRGDAG